MLIQINQSIDGYIDMSDDITRALREKNSPTLQAIRGFDEYFTKTLWREVGTDKPLPMMLAMNAYMLFLAGVRVAMTGHVTAGSCQFKADASRPAEPGSLRVAT